MYADVIRVSTNPQKVSFAPTRLRPTVVNLPGGEVVEITFLNEKGLVGDFEIDNTGQRRLDKTNPRDKHNLESLKRLLALTPSPLPPGVKIKVIDAEEVADQSLQLFELRMDAIARVQQIKENLDQIAGVARRLGSGSLARLTPRQVLEYVLKRADSDPEAVLAILRDQNQAILFQVDLAREHHILHEVNGYWKLGDTMLGQSDEAIVDLLRREPGLLAELELRNKAAASAKTSAGQARQKLREKMAQAEAAEGEEVVASEAPAFDAEAGQALLEKLLKTTVDGGPLLTRVASGDRKGIYYGTMALGATPAEACRFLVTNEKFRNELKALAGL